MASDAARRVERLSTPAPSPPARVVAEAVRTHAPARRLRAAVIAVHGMGQQSKYDTMTSLARRVCDMTGDPNSPRINVVNRQMNEERSQICCELSVPTPIETIRLEHPEYEWRELGDPFGLMAPGTELAVRLTPRPRIRVRVLDASDRNIEDVAFGACPWPFDFVPVPHVREIVDNQVEHLVATTEHCSLQVRAPGRAHGTIGLLDQERTDDVITVQLAPEAVVIHFGAGPI